MPEFDPTQIDTLLETLTGVVRARVRPDENGRQLREIHVLSDGALTASDDGALTATIAPIPAAHAFCTISKLARPLT